MLVKRARKIEYMFDFSCSHYTGLRQLTIFYLIAKLTSSMQK